jgi:hypothetical protein
LRHDFAMAHPIPIFIISYQRPLYLWACLDSLYRHTKFPCRFILADNASPDPQIRGVLNGFQRRSMFHALHLCDSNDPARVPWMIETHRDLLGDYFCIVESDVYVAPSEPCWLARYVRHMEENPRLGMLGSLLDANDFVVPEDAQRLSPDLPADELGN